MLLLLNSLDIMLSSLTIIWFCILKVICIYAALMKRIRVERFWRRLGWQVIRYSKKYIEFCEGIQNYYFF